MHFSYRILEDGSLAVAVTAKERMQAMMKRASILLLATHSLMTIQTMCNRAILMSKGRIVADGDVEEVASTYQALQSKGAITKTAQ